MSQQLVQYRVCDQCPSETEAVQTDRLSLNGFVYEIDLCATHSGMLYGQVMQWADQGTKITEPKMLDKPKVYASTPAEPRALTVVPEAPTAPEVPHTAFRWALTDHARERMVERGFTMQEVLFACESPEVVTQGSGDRANLSQHLHGRCLVIVDPVTCSVITVKVNGETKQSWQAKQKEHV